MRATSLRGRSRWPAISGRLVAVTAPWCIVVACAVATLTSAGDPLWSVARYLAAWALLVALPGVLVHRWLAGATTAPRDAGFGSVLGIAISLAAWVPATAFHLPWLTSVLCGTVLVVFAAHPSLRRHWRPVREPGELTPVRWHAAAAAVTVVALGKLYVSDLRQVPLPPRTSEVSQDFWYNTGIAYELARTLRVQDPSVVGERLHYHWFADAHVTATAQLSGTPIDESLLHLWPVAMLVSLVLVVSATAQRVLAGPGRAASTATATVLSRWWAGPTAALLVAVLPLILTLRLPPAPRLTDGLVTSSPSGILSIALVLALVGVLADVAHGRARRGTYVVLALLLALSAGTKPTILPVIACGCLVAAVACRRGGSGSWRPLLAVVGAAAVLIGLATPFVLGSVGGSHLQLFAILVDDGSYRRLFEDRQYAAAGGLWLPALADSRPGAFGTVGFLVLVYLGTLAPRLLALAGPLVRPLRPDPVTWLGAGTVGAGLAGLALLAHPGYSEHWFWTGVVGLTAVLVTVNAVRALPDDVRVRDLVGPLGVVAVVGLALAAVTRTAAPADLDRSWPAVAVARVGPYVLALVVALLLVVGARVAHRRGVLAVRLPALTVVTVFCVAATVPQTWARLDAMRAPIVDGHLSGVASDPELHLSRHQQRGALWLRRNSAPTDVVATNVFCRPVAYRSRCSHTSLWVAGLTGRRLVLGGWSYTGASLSRFDGTTGLSEVPSPWLRRLALSLAVVRAPTPAVVTELRERYGARWLFVDRGATPISPALRDLATLRYRNAEIEVYELRATP